MGHFAEYFYTQLKGEEEKGDITWEAREKKLLRGRGACHALVALAGRRAGGDWTACGGAAPLRLLGVVQVTPPEWPRKRISAVRYEVSAPRLGSRPSELCSGRTNRTRTHHSAVFGSHAAATCTAFVSTLVHVLRYTLNASQETRNGSAAVVRRGLAPVSSTTGVDSCPTLIL